MFDIQTIVSSAGYIGLFVIIFMESGVFFGFFLPGDSLLFTAGFLASQGYFNVVLLVVLLFCAAVMGDNVGYAFGNRVGPKLFNKPKSLLFNPAYALKAEQFFEKFGKMAIFLARFIPAVRTFIPIVAGVGKMKYSIFLRYNLVGGAIWVAVMTFSGYFLGTAIPDSKQYLHYILLVVILISFTPIIIEYFIYKRKSKNVKF